MSFAIRKDGLGWRAVEGVSDIEDDEVFSELQPGARAATPAEIRASLTRLVQQNLDAAAQRLGYDDIKSAVTYADEPAVPAFQAEGAALRAWRSLVWAQCYTIMAAVEAGQRAVPTEAELLAELPAEPTL